MLETLERGTYNAKEMLEKITFGDFDFGFSEEMSNWDKYGFVKKDVSDGELKKVVSINNCQNGNFDVICDDGVIVPCVLKKEKKFFSLNGIQYDELSGLETWLTAKENANWFNDENIHVAITVDGFNVYGSLSQAYLESKRYEFIGEIRDPKKVYYAKIKERNNGGFLVDIKGVDAFLPGSLASANKIIDFNDFVGKEVPVMFEDYIKDGDTFIVSNKKYIQQILPLKINELKAGDECEGEITGTIRFGIFLEFNDIMTGLLHTSEMTPDTLAKFKEGFYSAGDKKKFFIKEITDDKRIILTEKLSVDGGATIEEFKTECESTIYSGEVMSIKDIGVFVRFEYKDVTFIGLLHKNNINDSVKFVLGDKMDFFVSKVDADTKKVFLKLPIKNDK